MAQRLKAEVREALLKAAGEAFSESGFEGARLGDIVERAGTSIGNFYKYFANKDELFAHFIPRGFTADLTERVRMQVRALRSETDVFSLGTEHPYYQASEELLRFAVAHRERVVFLLLRAHGTRHEGFAAKLTRVLVVLALEYTRLAHPTFAHSPSNKRALTRIYKAFVSNLGTILTEERGERGVRDAVALHAVYHLSGLRALFAGSSPSETAGGPLS